jgi:putative mRNA 3-end processing factor
MGSQHYLCAQEGERVLRARLGDIHLTTLPYGETKTINGVAVSLHPAGHILGSAQIRLEHKGQVCVVTGDYKIEPDPTCTPFELVKCHTFVTESTFALPAYRWQPQQTVFDDINTWWQANAAAGKASLVFAYALGKAQRVLRGLDSGDGRSIGPTYAHGAVQRLNEEYRKSGIALPETLYAGEERKRGESFARALVLAPPGADGTPWVRRFGDYSSAFASGWMRLRGAVAL